MRVKATQKGYDGTQLREVGDVFEIPEFRKGKDGKPLLDEKGNPAPVFHSEWMEKTDEEPAKVELQPIAGNPGAPPLPTDAAPVNKGGRPRKT